MFKGLELTLLGEVCISHHGIPLSGFVSSKAQALLCYLVITGQTHSRDELAGLLWGDMPEPEARANLRVVLSNLRHLVGPYLNINRQSVAFNPQSATRSDIADFLASMQHIETTKPEHHIETLHEAAKLYRGNLMHGFYVRDAPDFEEWLLIQRERCRQLAVQTFYLIAAHHTMRGEYLEGIQYTSRLLEMEPWHEEFHRQLMLLLALSGQRSAALMQFETCQRVLAQELGVTPAEETVALYQRIQDGICPTAGTNTSFACSRSGACPTRTSLLPLPFVGRGKEYHWLINQWEDAQKQHHGILTLVEGEAGVGKTRLVEEIVRYAAGSGAIILRGDCHNFTTDVPYQPVVEALRGILHTRPSLIHTLPEQWLTELSHLLPELHDMCPYLPTTPPPTDAAYRQRLFESVAYLLKETTHDHQHMVVFLDDIHYADPITIDLLRYLLYRLQDTPVWWIGAYRPEEMASNNPLLLLRHELGRSQRVALLHLNPLDTTTIAHLVEQLPGLDTTQTQALTTYLSDTSEGNAFILTEMVQEIEHRGIIQVQNNRWCLDTHRLAREQEHVPFGVQSMIQDRISHLEPHVHILLNTAAVIGPSFDLRLIALSLASSIIPPHEIDQGIEELLTRRLIREAVVLPTHTTATLNQRHTGAACPRHRPSTFKHSLSYTIWYEFSHPMVRQVVYHRLSHNQLQKLHHQVAQARDQLYQGWEAETAFQMKDPDMALEEASPMTQTGGAPAEKPGQLTISGTEAICS